MKSQKKGQGAMEYLMTYGWAILIIAVVGVALWQLGLLSTGGRGSNAASGFTKIKVLVPSIKYSADTTNQSLNFTIVNGAGDLIRISSIGIGGDCDYTIYPSNSLDPGSTMIVGGWNCTILSSNEQFYVEVNISYSQKLGRDTIEHVDSGIIQGVAE